MSQNVVGVEKGFLAGSSLLTKQYHIAKQTADDTADLADSSTAILIGVIQNIAAEGDVVSVAMVHGGGSTKVVAGGTISRGGYITSDSNGKAIRAYQTGDRVVGQALQAAVAGDVFEMALLAFRFVAGSSPSASVSPSASASPSLSPSASESASRSPSASNSPSISPSASTSPSASASPS